MDLVSTSRKRKAARWIGLLLLLAFAYSPLDALADFQRLTLKSVTLVGASQSTQVILRETPLDSLDVDTLEFLLSGDSDLSLNQSSPLTYTLNASIYVYYSGSPGDTSVAWLVVWDDDHKDTIEITGIYSNSGTPDMAIMIPSFDGMEAGDTLCQTATIVNFNNYSVTVTGVAYSPYGPWSFPNVTFPYVLDPGDTLYVEICYIAYDSAYRRTDSVGFSFTGGGMQWNDVRGVFVEVGKCLSVSPRYLSFEYLDVNDHDTASFTIYNVSQDSITVDVTDLTGDTNNTYTFHGLPATIAPGDSAVIRVEVEVNVSGYAYKTWALERTDDDCGSISMSAWLYGNANHCFDVHWDSTSVGPIFMGDDTTITFTFVNTSDEEIDIHLNSQDNDSIATYSWSGSWPITLDPGDTVVMELTIFGDDIGNYSHELSFYSPSDSEGCDGYVAVVDGSVISNSTLPQIEIFSEDKIEIETNLTSFEKAYRLVNNIGSAVSVSDLQLAQGKNFQLVKQPILPQMLLTDEGLVTRLLFEASTAGIYDDTLLVWINFNSIRRIPIRGNLVAGSVGAEDNVVHFEAWPNPASSQLNVSVTNARSATLSVTDMLGRTAHYESLHSGAVQSGEAAIRTTVDLRSMQLTAGNYIVRISGTALSGAPFVQSTLISVQ